MDIPYQRIRDFLSSTEHEETDCRLLSKCEELDIDVFFQTLTDVESVTTSPQHDRLTVCDDRALFDEVFCHILKQAIGYGREPLSFRTTILNLGL